MFSRRTRSHVRLILQFFLRSVSKIRRPSAQMSRRPHHFSTAILYKPKIMRAFCIMNPRQIFGFLCHVQQRRLSLTSFLRSWHAHTHAHTKTHTNLPTRWPLAVGGWVGSWGESLLLPKRNAERLAYFDAV